MTVTHQITHTGRWYKGVTCTLQSPNRKHGWQLTYTPGTTVEADGLAEDPAMECGSGINFSRTIAEALRWGPVVVWLEVPASERIIDAGDKLRARTVRVVEVVDLTDVDLGGAWLAAAKLAGAKLPGANLARADRTNTNLARADLTNTYLAHANLAHANLADANLAGAYLGGAYLARANLAGANLARARGVPASGMPEGWTIERGAWLPSARRDVEPEDA